MGMFAWDGVLAPENQQQQQHKHEKERETY